MAIPKVKVTFDADLTGLKQGTKQAQAELSTFEKGVAKFGAAAKAAFAAAAAAAAAYAVKLGVDGVKAAIEDEQAQARLAQTLQKAAGATKDAVAQTEAFISKMQLATGVADTDLRAAMGRLTLSTNNVTKAQDLLALSLDISKATGKSVETVANALGKAYDGQTTALGKLGIGLSSSELKTMSFEQTQKRLSDLFGGAAARNADTFQGKIDIMRQRFAEFQESVGNKIIPILLSLFNMIDTKIVPAFNFLKEKAIDPVIAAINRNKEAFAGLGDILSTYVVPILTGAFAGALVVVGKVASGIVDVIGTVAKAITSVVNGAITGINALIKAYNAIPLLPNIPTIPSVGAPKIDVPKVVVPPISGGGGGSKGSGSTGGTSNGGGGSMKVMGVAETISNTAASSSKLGTFASVGAKPFSTGMSISGQTSNVTINVNAPSVIDEQGFTNSVIQALNNSTYRGTAGAGMLTGLAI